ncbi:MAG: hypothetical protein WA938_02560 [Candidatus Dormiibacterota bacterium]
MNWVKDPQVPPSEYVLDDRRVSGITTSLREGDESPSPEALPANAGRAFQGPIPVGEGFVLTPDEAREILADGRAPYERVIRPYLIGDDIANEPHQRPSRWIIDFASMPTTLRRWGSGRSRARVYLVRPLDEIIEVAREINHGKYRWTVVGRLVEAGYPVVEDQPPHSLVMLNGPMDAATAESLRGLFDAENVNPFARERRVLGGKP